MIPTILSDKHVLVAEDNAINQMVVKHTLLKMGATADIASDGAEAIDKFKNNKYDLILMDIQMPLMDGYEATEYIRKQLNSNVPIIAMTAFALNGEDEKCLEYGMDNYVSKPFSIDDLTAVIQKVLALPLIQNDNQAILVNKDVSVDLSLLYDISGDDESYITMMVQTFLETMPATLNKINNCLNECDWDGLFRAAHYAKSSLSVIKVKEMFEVISVIEENAKSKVDLHLLPELVEKANRSFQVAEEVLLKKFGVKSI